VPQGREIFPQLTVEENLRVGWGVRRGGVKAVPPKIFELFPVLAKMLTRRGGDLSGGQQQQLAIGRALVLEPQLLILDEPTEGIQPNIVHEIGDVILSSTRRRTDRPARRAEAAVRPRVASEFRILEKGRSVAEVPFPRSPTTWCRSASASDGRLSRVGIGGALDKAPGAGRRAPGRARRLVGPR
jgi:urea transport system ATP-binding protein